MSGDARPLAVYVHGYSCTRGHWEETADRLRDLLEPVLVSLPGHDGTPLPEGRLDMAACAKHVNAAAEGAGRPGLLVGHSLGGMAGMICAHGRPELYSGLVLVDAFPRLGPPAPFNRSYWEGSPPELKASIIREMMEVRRGLPDTLWESVVAFDGGPLLAEMRVPVRGIYGDRGEVDHELLEKSLRATGLGDAQIRVVGRAGHFVMLEQPERFCEALAHVAGSLAGR